MRKARHLLEGLFRVQPTVLSSEAGALLTNEQKITTREQKKPVVKLHAVNVLHIFLYAFFSPDIGQSGTCPQLVCSSLSAFPGTSGLIARLLNNPHSNLSQLKLTYVSLFTEHFWTR